MSLRIMMAISVAATLAAHPAVAQETGQPLGAAAEEFRQKVDVGDVMLIVDSSGSMAGLVDGRSKRASAADATQELLAELTKSTFNMPAQSIGLMLYGHRRARDCTDINVAVPPRRVSDATHRAEIMREVRSAKPLGMTPIAASLTRAADALGYRERPATVILISDGIETCHLDPCAEAERLHRGGVRFIAHVVGYDVKTKEFEKLKCIADKTGGMAVRATAASELGLALRRFAERIVTDAVARATGSLEIEVMDRLGRQVGADAFKETPAITVLGAAYERRFPLTGTIQQVALLAGEYRVRLDPAGTGIEVPAAVAAGGSRRVSLRVGDGTLSALFRPAPGVDPFPADQTSWTILRAGDVASASTSNPAAVELPPGRYRAQVSAGPFGGQAEAQIWSGAVTQIEITPRPPFALLSVRFVQPAPDFFASVQVPRRLRVEVDTPAGSHELGRASDEMKVYVPPGRIRIPWTTGAESATVTVDVPPAGASRELPIELPAIAWILQWIGDEVADPVQWKIEALLEGRPTGAREVRQGPALTGTIPPGSYHVTVTRGAVSTERDVQVPARGTSRETFILKQPS